MRNNFFLSGCMAMTCLLASPAFADCSSPNGKLDDTYYQSNTQTVLKCDGLNWAPLIPPPNTNPARAAELLRIQNVSWWIVAFPQTDEVQKQAIQEATLNLQSLIRLPASADFNQTVDAVRQFVYTHSEHNMDEEFYSYWHDIPQLMQRILKNATNPQEPKPHMECATRTAVMYHLLRALNIRSRPVVLYPNDEDENKSHTYLSVYNPDTNKWHAQDPDYNVFWLNRNTHERASTRDLLFNPVRKTFVPCHNREDCGYDSEINPVVPYFSLAVKLDIDKNDYKMEVNLDRFSPDKLTWLTHHKQPYCEMFTHGCLLGHEPD